MITEATCTKCGIQKPISKFGVARKEPLRMNTRCNACLAAYMLAYKARLKIQMKERERVGAKKVDPSIPPIVPGIEIRLVPGYVGYAIGNEGSAWTCHAAGKNKIAYEWRLLKPAIDRNRGRYPFVNLTKDGKHYCRKIHRLVLEAFVGSRPKGMVCRHLDGDPSNNHVDNLAWGTYEENCQDTIRHGTFVRGSKNHKTKLSESDIPVIRELLRSRMTQKDIAARYGVHHSVIQTINVGRTWCHVQ